MCIRDRSTTVLILSILNRKDMYGYEMIKEIDLRSKGIFSFKEGTLYPILHNLENANYIESYWDDSNSGRKRKYYKITDNGKKLLLEKMCIRDRSFFESRFVN